MFKILKVSAFLTVIGLLLPSFSLAITPELLEIYTDRQDLQQCFDPVNYRGIEGTGAGFLIDLEDWARQYGWQSYPELTEYAPANQPAQMKLGATSPPVVTADNYIILDNTSGTILAAQSAEVEWPIASITKLVTSKTALDYGLDAGGIGAIKNSDNVGGARLWVEGGTTFRMTDLLYATLVGSANNAASAIARLTGLQQSDFISHMNQTAQNWNLGHTRFVDPTGIKLGNISTAREVAFLAQQVFQNENIRRMTGTWRFYIEALNDTNYAKYINSTNWLLYDPAYDDVYVTAGKTGYLDESGWNLVVRMHPMGQSTDKSVLIVLLGSDSRRESFDDAHALAWWSWNNFDWTRQ